MGSAADTAATTEEGSREVGEEFGRKKSEAHVVTGVSPVVFLGCRYMGRCRRHGGYYSKT